MADMNLVTQDWQIQFYRTGGVSIGRGYAYIDVAFWSDAAQFYGYARLAGGSTGAAYGALVARDESPWWLLNARFSINGLHGANGQADIDFGLNGNFDGVLRAWKLSQWLIQDRGFTGVGDMNWTSGAHATIGGTWQVKEVWSYS